MKEFEWKHPVLGENNVGGAVAQQLFEGKTHVPADIFVREDLQNRVDAKRDDSSGPVKVHMRFMTLKAARCHGLLAN